MKNIKKSILFKFLFRGNFEALKANQEAEVLLKSGKKISKSELKKRAKKLEFYLKTHDLLEDQF